MTTIFSTRKTLKDRFSKRILGMEALENREMLSVNPLGVDNYYSPEVVQTETVSQNFQTEVASTVTFTDVAHTSMKVSLDQSDVPVSTDGTFYLQYSEDGATDEWAAVDGSTTVTVTGGSVTAGSLSLLSLGGLDPGTTYKFRLNTNKDEVDDSSSTDVTLNGTQATFAAPTIASTSFDNNTKELTINLTGLVNGVAYGLSGTPSNGGTPSFSSGATFTADSSGVKEIKVTTSSTAFAIGETFDFTLKENATSTLLISNKIITLTDVIPGEVAVTGGTTVTGLTSNAATITVPKVKNAKTYDITVSGITPITGSTKNQVTVTGLDPDTKYEIKVTARDKDGKELNLDGTENTTNSGTPISLGSFSTWDEAAAASVKYPAINGSIAATYAATGKDYDGKAITTPGIKVTWKAPANYTGAYIVNIQKVTDKGVADGGVGTKTIPAGFKAEAFIVAADGVKVEKDAYYKITVVAGDDITGSGSPAAIVAPKVVVATGTNKIENYNDANAGDATGPQTVTTAAVTSSTTGFAIKATITPDTTPTNTVGYWVALYDSTGTVPSTDAVFDETDINIVALAYVANSSTTASVVDFGGLTDTAKTYKAVAWAVNADGEDAGAVVDNVGAAPTGPLTYSAAYTGAENNTYAGNLKTATVSGNPTSTKLTWANTQSNTATDVIVGWQVSYSIDDGDNWILAQHVAASTTEATVIGLNLADVKYQFKVQAIVQQDATTYANNYGLDKGATVTSSKANVTLAKVAKVTPATTQGANKIEASWAAVTGASAYFVTVQDGKGIVYQGIVTTNSFDSSTVGGLVLVPGVKYDISVSTIAYNGDKVVKAANAKAFATTVKFSDPVLKIAQGNKAGLTSVALAIEDKVAEPTSSTRKYVIEYTYIADAKNKADWSTALVQESATSTLSNLKAGTQYYARLVAYDSTSSATSSNAERIVVGKELKFKTVAAPLATLTKPAFALDNNELALKFTGKIPVDKTGANAVLQSGTKFFYELIVSTDAVLDKTTGKLANGKSFTATPVLLDAKGGSGKDKDEFTTAISQSLTGIGGVFEKLNAGTLDPATFKALNFQLLVYYAPSGAGDATSAYANAYTKVTKLTLPKWFV